MTRVAALAPELFFASKIEAALRAAGDDVEVRSTPEDALTAAADADVLIVDLHAPELDPAAIAARAGGCALLGFYSHVEVDVRRAAEEAGFDLVVPRSRMAREMPELVAGLARKRAGG